MKTILFATAMLFAAFLSFAPPCRAAESRPGEDRLSAGDVFLYPIHFYRKYLSGADGDRCPMHPSCSSYSIEAIRKHGPLVGYFMTCDRLLRCGRDETKLAPPIFRGEKTRASDPVSNNDFWWKSSKSAEN